jgi:phospholipase/carboxylesterase
MDALQHFQHIFVDNQARKTLFLLHGTGGDEHDLLPLVASLRQEYNFVGLKGNVVEQGMARFFWRSAAGVFDQESIRQETKKLAEFVRAWYQKYDLSAEETAFVGYSNGANMILATVFQFPDLLSRAVLLHSMLPFRPPQLQLHGKSFLVTYGEHDQMIPATESLKVIQTLDETGAKVEIIKHSGGHEVRPEEREALVGFLQLMKSL